MENIFGSTHLRSSGRVSQAGHHLEETKSGEFSLGREGTWIVGQMRRLRALYCSVAWGHPTVALALTC